MPAGASPLRDRDFIQAAEQRRAPSRERCREWDLSRLQGGELPLKELYAEAEAAGHSDSTMHRTMTALYREKQVTSWQEGFRSQKRYMVKRLSV